MPDVGDGPGAHTSARLSAALTPCLGDHEPPDVALPAEYIRIVHHRNSGRPDEIISLLDVDESAPPGRPSENSNIGRPAWAPFRSYADFKFAETVVTQGLTRQNANVWLENMRHIFTLSPEHVMVSFWNSDDLWNNLESARTGFTQVCINSILSSDTNIIQFREGSVTQEFRGGVQTVNFRYRDPWEWILSLIKDTSLIPENTFFSTKKYLCIEGKTERLIDEPWTADTWAAVDVCLACLNLLAAAD